MTYKILSTRQVGETLFTNVEYTFPTKTITVEVAHFMPDTTQDITTNIINRGVSELTKITYEAAIAALIPSILINEINNL